MKFKKSYFNDFPQIEYQGKIARNLMSRPKIKDQLLGNPNAFYDYVISDDMRPDQVAYFYYDDPSLVWLIFLANKIVDPYYQWPMTDRLLDEYLKAVYGNDDPILHYKHNTTGAIISTDTYTLNGTFSKIIAGQYTAVRAVASAREENDKKRTIKLLDKKFASKAKSELKRVMNV